MMGGFVNKSAPVFDLSFFYGYDESAGELGAILQYPDGSNKAVAAIGVYTNCYEYAVGSYDIARADPGNAVGMLVLKDGITAENITKLAEFDGLQFIGEEYDSSQIPEGFYPVALYIKDGKDYHWIRQDRDGTWSGKDGSAPPYRLTRKENGQLSYNNGTPVTEPPETFGMYERVGIFIVPEGGIDVGYDRFLEQYKDNPHFKMCNVLDSISKIKSPPDTMPVLDSILYDGNYIDPDVPKAIQSCPAANKERPK